VPEQPTSALQVSDIWHKIKCHIGPNLAFLYGGHDLGWRATKTKTKKKGMATYDRELQRHK
jgi:hypothetical protein